MKKFEYFLLENSWLCWLLRVCIALIWIFWITGLWQPVCEVMKEEWNRPRPNPVEELRANRAMMSYIDCKVEKAKSLGLAYSPKEYFQDLKEVRSKHRKMPVAPLPMTYNTGQLQSLVNDNWKKGYYTSEQFETEAKAFHMELEASEESRQEAKKEFSKIGWLRFLHWLLNFYLLSLPLAFFLYLIRMVERKGILETILADKWKFVLSIVFWFVFLFKYPYNVIREIRVEAELRRLGNFWRPLNRLEKNLVRQVAASSDFTNWIQLFRKENAHRFRRSLILGLLAALLFTFFLPVMGAVKSRGQPNAPPVTSQISQLPSCQSVSITDLTGEHSLLISLQQCDLFETLKPLLINVPYLPKLIIRGIDHVPLVSF